MATNRLNVVKMYRSGMTYAAIAKKVGVSRQRVQQIVRPSAPIYRKLQQRAKNRCENCGIFVRAGHAHHLLSDPVSDVSDITNLLYLCPTCHRVSHWSPAVEVAESEYTAEVAGCYCLHCEHEWVPRRKSGDRPGKCPNCKSPNWDKPRKWTFTRKTA